MVSPLHDSLTSQGPATSLQTFPEVKNRSVGQRAPFPVHFSSTSQVVPSEATTLGLQTCVEGAKTSGGQLSEFPEHTSWTSHAPALALQTVVADKKTSVGHWAPVPVQTSATSQVLPSAPITAARQTTPIVLKLSVGQELLTPLQVSILSHSPAAFLHDVPVDMT